MEELTDNELGFITNTLSLETNSLFNDELNLNSITHDYIKNGDDLFLSNDDENWLSSLDNVNSFNVHTSLNVNQSQNCSINHNSDHDSLNSNNRTVNPNDLIQKSLLVKKKRKLELYDNSNASFINGLLNNDEVENVIEISNLDTKPIVKIKTENQIEEEMNKVNLNNKAAKLLGKQIKSELVSEIRYIKKENDELDEDTDQDDDDQDEDEEIDELLQFPVSSSILDDQCGSPSELNQLSYLIHDSDSGSSHFDDGYQSSATSTNYNLNTTTNHNLLTEGKRQLKGNLLIATNQSTVNQIKNDQLYQVHNYSCIKQDKFLHSANNQLNNQELISTNNGNQLIYLKHDGLLNGNYTSSNSSLSGGSNSSSPTQSPTQSPNARKSNYGRRAVKSDERSNGLRSSNLKLQQQQQQQTSAGRGSRSKPITDLHLTDEERRLLNKEGYPDFPAGDNPTLSKMEEKILRKIRRKIRNKRSAQCSRQRKKEYLEELEKKYSKSTNEVQCLKSEIIKLRRENVSLISKLQKLMRFVDNSNQNINLNDDQMSTNLEDQQLPEKICGEISVQINSHDDLKSIEIHQTQSDQLDNLCNNNDLDHCETNELNTSLMDNEFNKLDDDDDPFNLLASSSSGEIQFDFFENFEMNDLKDDLKDDGLLRFVNQFTNDSQIDNQFNCTDYHQQAPVKTSLFILVLCFVLMFVPFLRPDGMDNSLNYLENQIGLQTNELITSNQLTSIL